MRILSIFICGLIFGLGLAISGMLNPSKVSAFLDLAGAWDPSLAFVMGGGLMVKLVFFHFLKRPSPYFAESFALPSLTRLDKPLLIGAALFGIGWRWVDYARARRLPAWPMAHLTRCSSSSPWRRV